MRTPFQLPGLEVLGISWVRGCLWPPAFAGMNVTEKGGRGHSLLPPPHLPALDQKVSKPGVSSVGLLELPAWGDLLSLGALPVDLGVPRATLSPVPVEEPVPSSMPYVCGAQGTGLLGGVSGAEGEALRQHPAKRQASCSRNVPCYKSQASCWGDGKGQYSL